MILHFIFAGYPPSYKTSMRFSGEVHCWLTELLLLIEGSPITRFFLLREFSSHVLSYWRTFLFLSWKDFYHLFLLIEGIFFVCSLIFFWSIRSCSLHIGKFLGSSSSFLTFCLDTSFRTFVYFINFFMTEGMVSLGVATTMQDGYPQRKAECLRCQGNGKSYIWNWKGSSTS